ncbi:hypothetical protein Pryu01_01463 [Paraliobacillus ryukyuensis]|uniref:Uncharacterized protein n=1 Tax=Paraliobacillus ryukyuensis TaxID=200904 RepID=A0A366EBQ8_9BACI|nr:hypothetical protein [Paraliobacillus ryukyuensis]RBO99806.1 hypothetical protein DES48_103133 [Paraliobacillus ryukyuensis]
MTHDSKDIHYLLRQQKRYKKIIKSYQQNDLTKEYHALKQMKEKLTSTIMHLQQQNTLLTQQLTEKERKIAVLQKEKEHLQQQLNQPTENDQGLNMLQEIVTDEIHFHFMAIYYLYNHWVNLYQHTSKEVLDMTEANHIDAEKEQTHEKKTPLFLNKPNAQTKSLPAPKPKPFHFKDLQDYQQAYILPDKQSENNLTEQSLFTVKTKQFKKIKANQFKKSNSLHAIVEPHPTEQSNKQAEEEATEEFETTEPHEINKEEVPETPTTQTMTKHPEEEAEQQENETATKSFFRRFLDYFKSN